MPQTTITVSGIIPPAPGKKQGKIADSAGGTWNVWGDKLPNYRMGVTYNITYEENEFNNVKYNVIKNAEPAGQGTQQTTMPLTQPSASVSPQGVFLDRDRQIWVNALLGKCLANPNVDPFNLENTKIAEKAKFFEGLFDYLFKPKVTKAGGEMDDEIPF
jgi:hypothetical protein